MTLNEYIEQLIEIRDSEPGFGDLDIVNGVDCSYGYTEIDYYIDGPSVLAVRDDSIVHDKANGFDKKVVCIN